MPYLPVEDARTRYYNDLSAFLLGVALEDPEVDYDPRRRTLGSCPRVTWRGYTFCDHTIPKLEKLARITGSILIRMIQGSYSTSTSASGGTHDGGGAGDNALGAYTLAQDYLVMNLARDECLLIYWPRPYVAGLWSNHGHFIDPHCPHLSPQAAAQVVLFRDGYDGLASKGKDFGSRASVDRIMAAYRDRYNTTPERVAAAIGETQEEDELVALMVKHPITGEMWTASNALWSMWTYILQNRDNLAVLNKAVVALAESERLDDAARASAVAAVAEQVRSVQADVDAIDALLREEPNPPEPDPAYTFGFDMSGHQTVAQVQAELDNPNFTFAIIKATEGEGFVNPLFSQQAAAVRASDNLAGWYHFCWQNQDGVKEAQHFWRTIEPFVKPGDNLFGDVENWDQAHNYAAMQGVSWQQRFDYYMTFRAELERLSGSIGNIYPLWTVIKAFRDLCGMRNADGTIKTTPTPEWTEFTRAGLWLPQYYIGVGDLRHRVQPGEYDTVDGGWPLFIHQYTSDPFDQNWMPGGRQLWGKYALA